MHKHWSDVYPHDIWTNILTFRGKVVDYKIGGDKREWRSWTFAWDKDMIENKEEFHVIQLREVVNNDKEHEEAFNKGGEMVSGVTMLYGRHEYV